MSGWAVAGLVGWVSPRGLLSNLIDFAAAPTHRAVEVSFPPKSEQPVNSEIAEERGEGGRRLARELTRI